MQEDEEQTQHCKEYIAAAHTHNCSEGGYLAAASVLNLIT